MRRERIALLVIPISAAVLIAIVILWAKSFTVEETFLVKGGITVNETGGYRVYFDRVRGVEYKILFLEARSNVDLKVAVIYRLNGSVKEALSDSITAGSRGYIKLPRGAQIETVNLKSLNPPVSIPFSFMEGVEPGVLRIGYEMLGLGVNAILEARLRIERFNVTVIGEGDFTIRMELYDGRDLVGVVEEYCSRACNLELSPAKPVTSVDIIATRTDRRAQATLLILGLIALTLLTTTLYTIAKTEHVKRKLFKTPSL